MDVPHNSSSSSNSDDMQEDLAVSLIKMLMSKRRSNKDVNRKQFFSSEVESHSPIRKLLINFFRKLENFTAFIVYFTHMYVNPLNSDENMYSGHSGERKSMTHANVSYCNQCEKPPALKDNRPHTDSSIYLNALRETLFKLVDTMKKFHLQYWPMFDTITTDRYDSLFIRYLIEVSHILMDFIRTLLFRFSNLLRLNSSASRSPNIISNINISQDERAFFKEEMLQWQHDLNGEDAFQNNANRSGMEGTKSWFEDEEEKFSNSKPISVKDSYEILQKAKNNCHSTMDHNEDHEPGNCLKDSIEKQIQSAEEEIKYFISQLGLSSLGNSSSKATDENCSNVSKDISGGTNFQLTSDDKQQTEDSGENPLAKCCLCGRATQLTSSLLNTSKIYCKFCIIHKNKMCRTNESNLAKKPPNVLQNDRSFSTKHGSSWQSCEESEQLKQDGSSFPGIVSSQNLCSCKSPDDLKMENFIASGISEDEEDASMETKLFCKAASSNIYQNNVIQHESCKEDPTSFLPGQNGFSERTFQKSQDGNEDKIDSSVEALERYHHIISLDVTHFANVVKENMIALHQEEQTRGIQMTGIENEYTVLNLLSQCIEESFFTVAQDHLSSSDLPCNESSQQDIKSAGTIPKKRRRVRFQTPCSNTQTYEYFQSQDTDIVSSEMEAKGLANFKRFDVKDSFANLLLKLERFSRDETSETQKCCHARCMQDMHEYNLNEEQDDGHTLAHFGERDKTLKSMVKETDKNCAECSKDIEKYLSQLMTGHLHHDTEIPNQFPPTLHMFHDEKHNHSLNLVEVRELENNEIRVYTVRNPEHSKNIQKLKRIAFNLHESLQKSSETGLVANEELNTSRSFKSQIFQSRLLAMRYLQGAHLVLKLHRADFIEEAFKLLMYPSSNSLSYYKDIHVVFKDEHGKVVDGHIVERHFFFSLLAAHIFNAHDNKLFEHPNPGSSAIYLNPNCKMAHTWFQFAGVVLALSFLHQKPLGVRLPQALFKCLLERTLMIEDMLEINSDLYHKLNWIAKTNLNDSPANFTFTVPELSGDYSNPEHELIPHGKHVIVTDDNKEDYIERAIKWKFIDRYAIQLKNFKEGFTMVLDPTLLSGFTAEVLQQLVLVGYLEHN